MFSRLFLLVPNWLKIGPAGEAQFCSKENGLDNIIPFKQYPASTQTIFTIL